MSQLIYGEPAVDAWVAQKLGLRQWPMSYSIANVTNKGDLMGATVFHDYYPETGVVQLTSVSDDPRWMSRRMINAVFTYAFDTLGCQLVVLRVSEHNSRMRNIADGLGFKSYTIPRLRGREEADVIYTLTDDDWRASRYRSN